ncbi:unnamed protein product [Sphagnum jensenii]|uniref:Uncharacterized protein n=1 Tax=Sphagnum jensenii TaxID=128206 RepID=A0ABP0WXP0_9BRYO
MQMLLGLQQTDEDEDEDERAGATEDDAIASFCCCCASPPSLTIHADGQAAGRRVTAAGSSVGREDTSQSLSPRSPMDEANRSSWARPLLRWRPLDATQAS